MSKKFLYILSFFVIGIIAVLNANAFIKGENRILNSGFEGDQVGEPPAKWELAVSG